MQTLMEDAAALCLAITAHYISLEPTFADAAAVSAGRLHLWAGWETLADEDKLVIANFLRCRPIELAQPNALMLEVHSLLSEDTPLFEVVGASTSPPQHIVETDRYRVVSPLVPERLIAELYHTMATRRTDRRTAEIPKHGDIVLKQFSQDGARVFLIPERFRLYLDTAKQSLTPRIAASTGPVHWKNVDLTQIAAQLDCFPGLHESHLSSLRKIVGDADGMEAMPGDFYRVNAPTGTGKSVLVVLLALDAARRGHKITIAVPNLVDVRNMCTTLTQSAKALGHSTTVAPLHSQKRIAELAKGSFVEQNTESPYQYTCLLNAFSSDGNLSAPGAEPCFNLYVPVLNKKSGEEKAKRINHCPFLFTCGMSKMLERALEADIVVVNHHSLLSGTTRIPMSDQTEQLGTRSFIELLLKRSDIFLVDEIDGLLQTAIEANVFELELGSHYTNTLLSKLRRRVEFAAAPIHDMKPSSIIRVSWALSYCTLTVNELLNLLNTGYFAWPKKDTTWPAADDGILVDKMRIDRDLLTKLFEQNEQVPDYLRDLQNNLAFWARNDGTRSPQQVATELQRLLDSLAMERLLVTDSKPKERQHLKASLLLRGRLTFLEQQLRSLQRDLPALIRANIEYANEVQQALKGPEPFSPMPNGPLHRTVYGFKRKDASGNESTLHVVAMRGDPHKTILAIPDITALMFAQTERVLVGFSATSYFPGASCFDLPAKDLVDVPDVPGSMSFEDVGVTVAVSGAPMHERSSRIRALAKELWPWLRSRIEKLKSDPATANRARLLLVTGSDDDAEELASALYGIATGPGKNVVLVRSSDTDVGAHRIPADQKMTYAELGSFAQGPHAQRSLVVSSIFPMARGHNIVNSNSESALGGIVVCVRPLPSSDRPGNNLAHICYETGNVICPSVAPGEGLRAERKIANQMLYEIRNSSPAFSQQPAVIRHFTVMNILVILTQLMGRARRGGTAVTCYLADAAFFDGRTTWASLLDETVKRLKESGAWPQFARHHAALATAVINYVRKIRGTK